MIEGIGVDIVDIRRIADLLRKQGERFPQRLLGTDELRVFSDRNDKAVFLAGRFAAKEAIIKAIGENLPTRPPYSDIQIVSDVSGRPGVTLSSRLTEVFKDFSFQISISHEKEFAVAMALLQRNK